MAIRISGMISGLDTDSIVQELVSAYSTKKDKYVKSQTKLEWKMDAWKTMNSKIYGFYASTLSSMRLSSAYNVKTSSVSDDKIAKVTASSKAVNGTQKLEVNQLSASGYMTGGEIEKTDGEKVTGTTKLADIGVTAGSKVKLNDTEIEITESMNVDEFVTALKNAGVSANFDETNKRFYVSSLKAGKEGEFILTAANVDGVSALSKLGLLASKDINGNDTAEMAKYKEIAADTSKAGTDEYEAAVLMLNSQALTDAEKAAQKEKLSKAIEDKEAATVTIEAFEEQQAIVKLVNDYETAQTTITKYESKYTEEKIEENKKFIEDHKNDAADSADKIKADELQKEIDEYEAAKKLVDEKKTEYDAAVAQKTEGADLDSDYQKALAYVNDTDKIDEYNTAQTALADAENRIKEAKTALAGSEVASFSGNVARISGQDSEIVLNGATYKSATGTFSVNGLSITALELTNGNAVTINTATDTKGIYDKIRDMLGKYNELITEIDKAYNASSAKGYEPLTDEEKEEMTDTQIEKWETKIKDAILRRDSTLGNVSSSLKMLTQFTTTIDGKEYSLASFGIATQGYFTSETNEKGCLHIDGDEKDSATSGKEDKLMAAINNNPDAVVGFFQQFSKNMYDDLTKKMAGSTVSSAYTIYNDKQMSSEYSRYKTQISKWEDKVKYYEDYYYKQFSAMETALSELQSKTSALSGLLGGGM